MNITRNPILLDRMIECPFENPHGYIYIIENIKNGMKYIGKHTFDKPYIDPSYLGTGGENFKNAKLEYGIDSFKISVLEWVQQEVNSSYEEMEDFAATVLRWWDWSDTRILSVESYLKIAPYIGKEVDVWEHSLF